MKVTKSMFVCALCASAVMTGCGGKDKGKDVAKDGAEAVVEEAADKGVAITDDTVVASVDDEKLTYGEAIKTIKRVLTAQGAPADQIDIVVKQYAPQAIPELAERFVTSALLKAEAAKRGFSATAADVDEAISNMVSRLPGDMKIDDMLSRMGVTMEEARKELSDGLVINKLIDDVTKGIEVAEDAVKKFYEENAKYFEQPEQVEASHILIKIDPADATNETAKAVAKAKAEGLRAQILAGTNFADLAAAHSDCPSSAQGGSLGYFGRGQMVKPFEEAAFTLGTNEVSEVVETQFGFHVIKVTGKKAASKTPIDEVRERIKEHLSGEQKSELFDKFVEELKGKAKIFINKAVSVPPALPEMTEEEKAAALEAIPASEPVAIEAAPAEAPAEAKPAEEAPAAPAEAPAEK